MGLLHEALYRSESLARLDLREYVADLCAHLFRSYGADPQRVRLRQEVADISLDIDRAIPCGLIITELVSNALKYAFPGGRGGTLTVGLRAGADGGCALTVADDGGRWPAGLDFRAARTLGLRLVCDLTGQLGGEVRLDTEGRTAFTITFTP
jgi:two-component sensor histidine kinase